MKQLVGWQDHIVVDPLVLCGKPFVKGTRLTVEFILGLISQGWTFQEVLANYPRLTRDDIIACLEFAGERLVPPDPAG